MTIQSMTGFGRAERDVDDARVAWELRSVNGKGLDMRLRLPPSLERLEGVVKTAMKARLARGNVQANLQVDREAAGGLVVNEAAAASLVAAARRLEAAHGLAMPDAGTLLSRYAGRCVEFGWEQRSDDEEAR